MTELADVLRDEAARLGFDRIGFAAAERLERDANALHAWLDRGDHGTMNWMARTAQVRADVRGEGMLPEARTVVVVASSYGADEPIDLGPGRVARYARGRDYHRVLGKKLEALARPLLAQGHRFRLALDTKPVLERAWAERAGLGFIGKNACLIIPGLGSHVFLGCLITDAVLPPGEPVREGCGACTRCLDGCPTSAFRGPRTLDARRCISYLTIEHEGRIEPELWEGIGDRIFGCDVCQDVCPYNQGRAKAALYDAAFSAHPRFDGLDTEALLTMDEKTFLARMEGSPLRRAGRESMARNAALVLGNRGERRHLRVLSSVAESDESEVVREAAKWAAARIEAHSSSSADSSSNESSSSGSSSSTRRD